MKHRTQPLRDVNRLPISRGTLELSPIKSNQFAAHIAAGLQIHHPKAHKTLTCDLHFSIKKSKDARIVLTIHHGIQTKTVMFAFGKAAAGKKAIRFRTPPDKSLGYALPISIHAYAHRRYSRAAVRLKLLRVDLSS